MASVLQLIEERARRESSQSNKPKPQKRAKKAEQQPSPPKETKSKKWGIHPTAQQRRTLKLWFDGARFAYNLGVEHVNKTKNYSKKGIREGAEVSTGKKRVKKGEEKREDGIDGWKAKAPERLWPVPAKIRDAAVLDVQKACVALKAKENKFKRKLKFRTSKDHSYSMYVESQMLNCKTAGSLCAPLFGTVTDRSVMRTERGKELPKVFESDVRVQYERLTDRFFICMTVEIAANVPETQGRPSGNQSTEMQIEEEEGTIRHIAAIDPGIRTFATLYDPGRERIVEWGMHGGRKDGRHDGTELLGWLTRKIGRLERVARQTHGRHKQRIRKLANRIRQRVKDLTAELHHKLARWLCRNYSVVLLPKFGVKGISRRKGLPAGKKRTICRNAVRKLAQMSPFTFRQFLLHKAREFGTQILICDEYYTSKTCTRCGMLNHSLGASKTFACPSCSVAYDRDAGAARNILLRYIS